MKTLQLNIEWLFEIFLWLFNHLVLVVEFHSLSSFQLGLTIGLCSLRIFVSTGRRNPAFLHFTKELKILSFEENSVHFSPFCDENVQYQRTRQWASWIIKTIFFFIRELSPCTNSTSECIRPTDSAIKMNILLIFYNAHCSVVWWT